MMDGEFLLIIGNRQIILPEKPIYSNDSITIIKALSYINKNFNQTYPNFNNLFIYQIALKK